MQRPPSQESLWSGTIITWFYVFITNDICTCVYMERDVHSFLVRILWILLYKQQIYFQGIIQQPWKMNAGGTEKEVFLW